MTIEIVVIGEDSADKTWATCTSTLLSSKHNLYNYLSDTDSSALRIKLDLIPILDTVIDF